MSHKSVKLFISYSHVDDEWQKWIADELGLLDVNVWRDGKINPGDSWREEIERELAAADIILLLISRDFLTSEFVKNEELPKALERLQHEDEPPRVVPVLLRETTWKRKFNIAGLQAIPTRERWLTSWGDKDSAIRGLAEELEGIVEDIKRVHSEREDKEENYRKAVAEALADDDDISIWEQRTLDKERLRLGLTEGVAEEIKAAEQRRVEVKQENIREYEEDIEIAIRKVGRRFDDKTREELKIRKSKLELRDDDVVGLEERVAARLDEEIAAAEKKDTQHATPKGDQDAIVEQKLHAAVPVEGSQTDEVTAGQETLSSDYRQQVAEAVVGGRLTQAKKTRLAELRKATALPAAEAKAIEQSEIDAARARASKELRERKAKLELREDDVTGLEDQVTARIGEEVGIAAATAEADRTVEAGEEPRVEEPQVEVTEARFEEPRVEEPRVEPGQVEPLQAEETYRQALSGALSNGRITMTERGGLNNLKRSLGISNAVAQDLEASERSARKARLAANRKDRTESQEARVKALAKTVTPLVTARPGQAYVWPSIPETLLHNARSRSKIPSGEVIFLLFDCTAFGSAKDHWAFTDRSLYYRNTGSPRRILYSELEPGKWSKKGRTNVLVDGAKLSLHVSGVDPATTMKVLEAIKEQI